jgi:hypothetical protein
VIDLIWLPPRDSNPDMLIQSPKIGSDSKQLQQLSSAKRGKVKQNPQTIRKQNKGKNMPVSTPPCGELK